MCALSTSLLFGRSQTQGGTLYSKKWLKKNVTTKQWLLSEEKKTVVYPSLPHVFECFNQTPLSSLKVVLLGQEPYHGPKQANGLSFSVSKGTKVPPSLKNVYKELKADMKGWVEPKHGDLTQWAQRGVLLLNACLTVEQGKTLSHMQCGWQTFTDMVVKLLNESPNRLVFVLWGNFAKKKGRMINRKKHIVCSPPF